MRISLILGFFLVYLSTSLSYCMIFFITTEYYVRNATVGGDCSADKPCSTLNAAYARCRSYDIINVDGNINSLVESLRILATLTIRSQTEGSKVELEVNNIADLSVLSANLFSIENSVGCIIKDFCFIIAQSVSTPVKSIINVGSGSYLRLDGCIFQRKEIGELERNRNLQNYLIGSSNNGDVYIYNCFIADFISESSLISVNSFYCYNSTFRNITVEKGSVMSQNGENVDIIDSIFEDLINKDGNGGAMNIYPSGRLIMGGFNNVTSFSGCRSNDSADGSNISVLLNSGCGGAIYLSQRIITLNITNIKFDKNSKNLAQVKGNCMFVLANYIKYVWNKDNVPFMKSISSDEDFLYRYNDDEFYKIYSLKKLYNGEDYDGSNKLYVADGGSDGNDCSSSDNACFSVVHASSLVRYHSINIIFSANYTLNTSQDIESYMEDISLKSKDDNVNVIVDGGCLKVGQKNIKVNDIKFIVIRMSNTILDIVGEKVTINSLTFLPRAEILKSSYGFINVNGEDIVMKDCICKNIESIVSAITLTAVKVDVTGCDFEYCKSTNGNGGGLSANVKNKGCDKEDKNADLCAVKGCKFIGCAALNGGGMCLRVDKNVRRVIVRDNTFNNNSLTSPRSKGYDVYVRSDDFVNIVNVGNFPFLKELNETDESSYGEYSVSYSNNDGILSDRFTGSITINLAKLINKHREVDNLFVGDRGDDNNNCTDVANACESFDKLLRDYCYYNHSTNITIVGNYTLYRFSTCLGAYEYNVTGNDNSANLVLADCKLYLINKTTFTDLNIIIDDCRSYNCYIYSYAPLVQFTNVIFKPYNRDTIVNVPIIYSYYDLTLDSCSFVSLVHNDDFVFSSRACYNNININNCSFNNCISTGLGGGGLYLTDKGTVDFGYNVNVSNCEFNSCIGRLGGAMYVKLNYNNNFVFENIKFFNNNVTEYGYGKNIYVESDNYNYINYKKVFPELNSVADGDNMYIAHTLTFASLIDILNDKQKTIEPMFYIGDSGDSLVDCTGSSSGKLCSTFLSLTGRVNFNSYNVTIVGNYSSGLTSLSDIYYIIGIEGSNIIIISPSPSQGYRDGRFIIGFNVTVNNISIIINDSLVNNPISVQSGIGTFNSVSFKHGDDAFELASSIINVMNNAHLVIHNCLFNNFEGKINGLAISASFNSFGSLEITGTEFNNMKTNRAKGGAIYCSLNTNTTFVIEGNEDSKAIFKGCGALCDLYHYHIIWKEKNGGHEYCSYSQGGAIYLSVTHTAKRIYMNEVEFGGDNTTEEDKNKGYCGYDMFIKGTNLNKIMHKDNFTFLSNLPSKYEGIFYYGSLDGCNYDLYGTSLNDLKVEGGNDDDSKFKWWIVLLIVLIILVVVAIVVGFVVRCVCKRSGGGDNSKDEGVEKKNEMEEEGKEPENKKADGEKEPETNKDGADKEPEAESA